MTIPIRVNGEIIYAEHLNTIKAELEALQTNPITVVNDYIAEATYRFIVADPASNSIQVTLPSASANSGKAYQVKALETGAAYDLSNPVTVIATSGNVDNEASFSFQENKQAVTFKSTGTTWAVV